MAKAKKKTAKRKAAPKVPSDAKTQTKYITTRPVTVNVTAWPIFTDEAEKRFREAMADVRVWFFGYEDDPDPDPIAIDLVKHLCLRRETKEADAHPVSCDITLVFGLNQQVNQRDVFQIIEQVLYDHKLYSPTMTEDNDDNQVTYRMLMRDYKVDKHAYYNAGDSRLRDEPIDYTGSTDPVVFNPQQKLKRKLMR